MAKKGARQAAALKKALKAQGRNVTWLAKETGYSRGYVSNVLNGQLPWTEAFQRRALEALETSALVPVQWRNQTIHVPENIYRKAAELPLIVVESAYEEAWKRAWLQENAATTLAVAADRAFQLAGSPSAAA